MYLEQRSNGTGLIFFLISITLMSEIVLGSNHQALSGLMNKFKNLNTIQQRSVAAVVGAAVADAATRPCHWLYDRVKVC